MRHLYVTLEDIKIKAEGHCQASHFFIPSRCARAASQQQADGRTGEVIRGSSRLAVTQSGHAAPVNAV